MPSYCNSNVPCPDASKLFAFLNGPPLKPGQPTKPTPEETARDDAYNKLNGLDVTLPPPSHLERCALYCQAVQAAEAEKCRRIREKVSLALEKAGCPSNVTPKTSANGTGCLPCQGMYKPPSGIPSYVNTSSNTNAAAAGSYMSM